MHSQWGMELHSILIIRDVNTRFVWEHSYWKINSPTSTAIKPTDRLYLVQNQAWKNKLPLQLQEHPVPCIFGSPTYYSLGLEWSFLPKEMSMLQVALCHQSPTSLPLLCQLAQYLGCHKFRSKDTAICCCMLSMLQFSFCELQTPWYGGVMDAVGQQAQLYQCH